MNPRRRRWRTALLVLVFCGAIGGWLGFRAVAAERELVSARASLTTAREAVLDGRPADARAALDLAAARTGSARDATDDPVWRMAAAVPYAGATFDAVRRAAATADDLARQVLPPALQAAELLEPETLRMRDGAFDLDRLKAAQEPLTASAAAASRAEEQVVLRSTAPLPPFIGDAMDELAAEVADLAAGVRGAARAVEVAPAMLGADGIRRYFVLVQQTSESRGTGGLTGGFAVLEADRGRVRVTSQGSNADLRNGAVPVPDGVSAEYVELYEDNGAFGLWQNVNLSPDLPTVAQVVEARWLAQGGAPLDGVIALDGIALASILRGNPPLSIAQQPVPVDQLVQYLAVEQYRGVPAGADQSERKDRLSDVADVVSQRLASGEGDLRALLRGISDAVRSGHLRIAAEDPRVAAVLGDAGIDGSLPSGQAPVAYPVVLNASAGKLDHFLDRRVAYIGGACADDTRQTQVSVSLTNQAPAAGLPEYLTIRSVAGETTQSADSAVLLQVYASAGATLLGATLDGQPITTAARRDQPYLTAAAEGGLPVWLVQLDLPRGQARELVLTLAEPIHRGRGRVMEQPLARPLKSFVDVPACAVER